MSIKRKVFLQVRVNPNAPSYVKDCTAIVANAFIGKTELQIASMNQDQLDIGEVLTRDSDVRTKLIKQFNVDEFAANIYELSYKESKYKTLRHCITTSLSDGELIVKKLPEVDGKIRKLMDPYIQKLMMIYPDPSEPMETWSTELGGADDIPFNMISENFLIRVVPGYITKDVHPDKDEIEEMFKDLVGSTIAYGMNTGYHTVRKYLTTEYLPICPIDSTIEVQHLNVVVHHKEPAIGIFYGVQVGGTYYYGGDWVSCDIHNKGIQNCSSKPDVRKELRAWITDRTNRYLTYLAQEGITDAKAVYPSHFQPT